MQHTDIPYFSCDIPGSDDILKSDDMSELHYDIPELLDDIPEHPTDIPEKAVDIPEQSDDIPMRRIDTYAIDYYPEKDYIPMESMYKNMNVSYDLRMGIQSPPQVDIKNANELWVFIIKIKDIDNKFFNDVHNMMMDNTALPQNVISAKYYNMMDSKKNLSFRRCENGLLFLE